VLDLAEIAIRLGAATLAGAVLGLDRELEDKPIGIRTLALVALGAAIISVVAIDNPLWAEHPDAVSRVTQGLIQGVMAASVFSARG